MKTINFIWKEEEGVAPASITYIVCSTTVRPMCICFDLETTRCTDHVDRLLGGYKPKASSKSFALLNLLTKPSYGGKDPP